MLKKIIFLITPVFIIGVMLLVFIIFQLKEKNTFSRTEIEQPKGQVTSFPAATSSGNVTTLKVPAPGYENVPEMIVNTNNDGSHLENGLIKKYGTKAQFTIDKSEDGFAQGMIIIPGKQPKWWLAIEKNDQWKVVLDGYSYVNCKDITPYNFPSSIVPACWGKNTLINR